MTETKVVTNLIEYDFSRPVYNCIQDSLSYNDLVFKQLPIVAINNNGLMRSFMHREYGPYIYSIILSMMRNWNAFVMGGWVRDTISGYAPNDIDIYVVQDGPPSDIKNFDILNYIRKLMPRLFFYLHGYNRTFHITYGTCKYGYSSLNIYITINDEHIVKMDISIVNKGEGDLTKKLDFIQNSLIFKCAHHNIILETKNHKINQGVLTYMERRMKTTLYMLLKCVNLQNLYKNEHITKIINGFIGEKSMRMYMLTYTLSKSKPELCASHSSCQSEYNEHQTNKMLARCRKFRSRGYSLLNMTPCGPSCRYTKNKNILKILNFGFADN